MEKKVENIELNKIKGMWIPGEVAFNNNLSHVEKMVWWMIKALDNGGKGCFAPNQYLAHMLDVGTQTVSNSISKLVSEGYIERTTVNQSRVLVVKDFKRSHKCFLEDFNKKKKEYKKIFNRLIKNFITYKNIYNKTFPKGKRTLLHQIQKKQKENNFLKLSKNFDDIEKVFSFWNSLGFPFRKHRKGTKKEEVIKREIKQALKKNSARMIFKAIEDLHIFFKADRTVVNLKLPGYQNLSCDKFFHFDTFDLIQIEKINPKLRVVSWFEESLRGYDHLMERFGKFEEDTFPEITKKIRVAWEAFVESGVAITEKQKITMQDESNFRLCAKKLNDFIKSRSDLLLMSSREKTYPAQTVPYLFHAIIRNSFGKRVHTGWLVKDFLFNEQFPNYLRDSGLMKTQRRG